mmetsp:Transcript_31088/g.89155  ORF Transcript_31088/g.89155 Transcript_31088/m.89155 type:complete len:178 (-) Transcript_31088:258-791(-)
MSSLVVVGNTEEEEELAREDILERARLLQRYSLHEETPVSEQAPQASSDQPVPEANAENVEYYIVVRRELRRLEAMASCPDSMGSELGDEDLERLLDVPEEFVGASSVGGMPEDLAVIDSFTHPVLCARLCSFLGDADEPRLSEAQGASETSSSSSSDDAADLAHCADHDHSGAGGV